MSNTFSHGYALLIGVGETAHPEYSLPVTVKDMQAIKSILIAPDLCAYPDDDNHIHLLHDNNATRNGILKGLIWLKGQAKADPEATIVVYYSGHGWQDTSTGCYYLLPHDFISSSLTDTALDAQTFIKHLREIPAQRLLIVIDSCHAEGMATSKEQGLFKIPTEFTETALPKGLLAELKQGEGKAVFTSSRGNQKSFIRPDKSMSVFTYHIIEALQGAGNKPGDTVVRISNLMNHLGKTVPESVNTFFNEKQTPFFDTATEDFAVALLRGGKGLPPDGWKNNPQQKDHGMESSTKFSVHNEGAKIGTQNIVDSIGTLNINSGKN